MRHFHNLFDKIVNCDATAVSDVVNAREIVRRHEDIRLDDVFDVDEIAGLFAVAENRNIFICNGFCGEDRHGGGVCALRILTRAENVEVAQTRRFQLAGLCENIAVVFPVELCDCVRAFRLRDHRFHFRNHRIVAVNRRARAEAELLHPRLRGFFENGQQTVHIDVHALLHFEHGLRNADHCREVKDVIASLDSLRDGGAVADVAPDELHIQPFEIVQIAGPEVVQHADFRLAVEVFRNMAADESGSAGNQNSHFVLISFTSAFMRSICSSMERTRAIWVLARSRL